MHDVATCPARALPFKIGRTVVLHYTFYKHPERKHQLISCRDIGAAGAKASALGPEWLDGVVRLAGDGLTVKEMQATFQEVSASACRRSLLPPDVACKQVYGYPIPTVFSVLARFAKAFVPTVRDRVKVRLAISRPRARHHLSLTPTPVVA